MSVTTSFLAFLAGILSTLSPCVLPLIPIVLGTAATKHRLGPLALAGGLASSFVVIGLFVATIGFSIGLDTDKFRYLAAALMMLIGVVLLVPDMQQKLAVAAGPAAGWASGKLGSVEGEGWQGQFVVGLLLGAVWSPCVGPTLGAASVLAAQGQNLAQVTLTMLLFAFGAALPLLLLGLLSRERMLKIRSRLMETGGNLKMVLGGILLVIGLLVVSGFDKALETKLVELSPQWLTDLTTRY